MTAIEYYFRTASLWIVLALPIVFAVLTFAVSASFFRFIAAASFAIAAWWLLTQPEASYGQAFLWIGVLYIGLAVMMPFAKIATGKKEDELDVKEKETSLDRYAAKLTKNDAKYAKLRSLGRKKTIRRNPYEEGEEEA